MRLIVVLIALLSGGCAGVSKIDFTKLGRASWQRPDDVLQALKIEPGAQVADLGAGKGYFVPYLSSAVGPSGRVFAIEVEQEVTEALEERFPQANVVVVLGEYEDPLLPDGAIDLVLVVNTYHHLEERSSYFDRLRTDLAPGARVAIIEPNADLVGVLRLFLPRGHVSRAAAVVQEMEAAGYRQTERFEFLPVQIFDVFAPE